MKRILAALAVILALASWVWWYLAEPKWVQLLLSGLSLLILMILEIVDRQENYRFATLLVTGSLAAQAFLQTD